MKNFIMLAVGAAISFNVLAAEVFTVPTDTKASYTVLEKTRTGDMATITTKERDRLECHILSACMTVRPRR